MKKSCHKKNDASKRNSIKVLLLTLSVVLLLYATVSGTLAYLLMRTSALTNKFQEAYVECAVNSGESISVTNEGNVDAYIRAAIVVNWMSDSEDAVYGIPPSSSDYSIGINASANWNDSTPWYCDPSTGFYYCKAAIPAGATTASLVTGFSVTGQVPDGYSLSVEVVAEAIQAEGYGENGKLAVENAWGFALYGAE